MWYCGQRNEEFAKVCRERDELKRELEETREKLDAAIDGNVNLKIQLEKTSAERDALLSIVKNWGECEHCKHMNEKLPDEGCEPGAQSCYLCTMDTMEKIACCECAKGSRWEWRGVEDKT